MAESETIICERIDRILVITLNRPEVRNAFDRGMAQALRRSFAMLDEDRTLAAGVIAGAAGCFSSGMDLKAFAAGQMSGGTDDGGIEELLRAGTRKPLVAAVEGYALGAGLELALMCDVIVAARGSLLGIPEIRRALVARGGGLLRLSLRLPRSIAGEMALTGEPLAAERAYELGLVNHLAEPGETLDRALDSAGLIARNAPLAVAASKQVLDGVRSWPPDQFWERQQALTEAIITSADAREGARAFAERRDPVWTGT
jgi:enoyl-CoA hydratase